MFDLATFLPKLFQHRIKRNGDVRARGKWNGEFSSSRGQTAQTHLSPSAPESLFEPLPEMRERPLGQR